MGPCAHPQATLDFIAGGGDGYEMLKSGGVVETTVAGMPLRQTFAEYVKKAAPYPSFKDSAPLYLFF